MHVGWLDIGFIIAVTLAVCWVFEGATDKLAARLKNIELNQETTNDTLRMIESNMARAAEARNQRQETIEEQWLRENYRAPRPSEIADEQAR